MMLGDEAVALGALHAGISNAYAYPGTPSTEIFARVLKETAAAPGVAAHWAANEKSAYEQALGATLAGRRALVAMKHVGLNVAADPFVNSALLALGGGLVVAVADDPEMHSSQNEQDTRHLADFARVPCLEPATVQEAYDMTREAFDVAEKFGAPLALVGQGKGGSSTRPEQQRKIIEVSAT
jgi:indolepyruvate ferredoxin oxidoreductase alpha subunit